MSDNGHASERTWISDVLRQHEAPLLRFARRMLHDPERARDVVQDTFLTLCRQHPAKLDGHLCEWLYTVCRNKALDVLRKEKRMATIESSTPLTTTREPGPGEMAERQDLVHRILTQLETLPPAQQDVIRLKFDGGLTYAEIARVTEKSVSHVGVLLHEGLQALRRRLKDLETSHP